MNVRSVRLKQHGGKARNVLDESASSNAPHHSKRFAALRQASHQESCKPRHLKHTPPGQIVLCRAGSIRVGAGPAARGGNDLPPHDGVQPRMPQHSNHRQHCHQQMTTQTLATAKHTKCT